VSGISKRRRRWRRTAIHMQHTHTHTHTARAPDSAGRAQRRRTPAAELARRPHQAVTEGCVAHAAAAALQLQLQHAALAGGKATAAAAAEHGPAQAQGAHDSTRQQRGVCQSACVCLLQPAPAPRKPRMQHSALLSGGEATTGVHPPACPAGSALADVAGARARLAHAHRPRLLPHLLTEAAGDRLAAAAQAAAVGAVWRVAVAVAAGCRRQAHAGPAERAPTAAADAA
jgi:hypothetical protein